MREAGPYLGLGAQLAGSLLVFVAIGYWADRLLGTGPWLLVVCVMLGMVAIFVRIAYLVKRAQADSTSTTIHSRLR